MSKVKIIPDLRFPEFEKDGEWEKKPLEDVLQFQTGFPFDSEGFNEEGRGVRLIKNRDLKSDEKIVHYSKPYDEKYLVTNGDVLVGMDGDFTPIKWNKGVALLNQRVGRVLTNQKGDELFFLYFLSIHLKAIEEKTARTTVKHLSHSVVEKINEPIPKPQEQQKIASCLSSLDEIIATHSQKLNLLKDHKKGLMQNLFPQEGEKVPKYRFREFEKDGEWVAKTLGKICDVRDGTHDSPIYVSKGYPMITSKNLLINGMIDFDNVSYLSEDDYSHINKRSKVDIDDILFGMIGTIGNPVIVKNDGFAIKNVALIKSSGKLNQEFLLHQLKSNYILTQFEKVNAGGILKFIALGVIRNLTVIVPLPKEQQKIASCLSSLDALITAQAEKIAQLKMHKKGLMQGLFPKIEI
jgi:type I restriction enzyme S subunit